MAGVFRVQQLPCAELTSACHTKLKFGGRAAKPARLLLGQAPAGSVEW